jgi:hypothetical protein
MRFKTIGQAIGLACAFAGAGAGMAASPMATGTINGANLSFEQYTDTTEIGVGLVDANKLFFIDEQTVENVKSWYIFFDPACKGVVHAEITFSDAISELIVDKPRLDSTNSMYRNLDINYGSVPRTGLESRDFYAVNGNTLTIDWKASDPGDHIRVLTSIPEPQTYALLLAGLGLIGAATRRRKPSRV